MRERILRLQGGNRRRRLLLAVVASVAALGVFMIPNALGVHDLDFQLDGDVDDDAGAQDFDWANFFNASGQESPQLPDASRPGFTASSFDKDFESTGTTFSTSDTTTFATGSKDTLPITPGWECNFDNNVNSKVDIMNAYALAYTDPTTDDEILYFGLERNTNTGDANVAFWFLQDEVACSSSGGAAPFTGDHQNGDLLVVSAFTNGGDVSNVDVYEWVGEPDNGHLDPNPVITGGADCRDEPAGPPPDDACGIVNLENITTPWPTANFRDGVGTTLRSTEFYEGGVNLTANELGGKCFTTFLADTRSSQELNATLFDFSLGQLGECAATMTTQVSEAGPVVPGTPIRDTATVVGNRDITPTGTVTFFLCGPIATGACTTGGTELTNTPPEGELTGSGNTASANSPFVNTSTNPLGPGRYCFRAEWPGDSNYTTPLTEFGGPDGTNECFTVKDVSSITTAQKWLPQDTATVTTAGGTAVSGTVEFKLYESPDCTGTAVQTFTDSSAPFETNNTVYYESPGKTISWSATFTPSDPNAVQGSATTRCEMSVLTIDNSASAFPPPTP